MAIMMKNVNGCDPLSPTPPPPPPKCECMTLPAVPKGTCCGEEPCCASTECLPIILPLAPKSLYLGLCPYPLL